MPHESYPESHPNSREIFRILGIIAANKSHSPESRLCIPLMSAEMRAMCDEQVPMTVLGSRVDRARRLLAAKPDTAHESAPAKTYQRACDQLVFVECAVGQLEPGCSSCERAFTFNDLNLASVYYIFKQAVGSFADFDAQLVFQAEVFAGARLAAETYVLASMNEN